MSPARRSLSPVAVQCLVYLSFAAPIGLYGEAWPDARHEFGQTAGALGAVITAYSLGRTATSATDGMWPFSWISRMPVSSSRFQVDALTPRSGGFGGSVTRSFERAMRVSPGGSVKWFFLPRLAGGPYDAPIPI